MRGRHKTARVAGNGETARVAYTEQKETEARSGGAWLGRRPIGCALAILVVASAAFGYLVFLAPGRGASYTDPAAGFSLRYPPSWKLATDPDGSHPTLLNPVTGATISASATTVSAAPDAVLSAAVPQGATQVHQGTLAGAPAVDFVVPGHAGVRRGRGGHTGAATGADGAGGCKEQRGHDECLYADADAAGGCAER